MKNTIAILLLSFVIIIPAYSQVKSYYGIDGSKWVTEAERDKHEKSLWMSLDLTLIKISTRNKVLKKRNNDTYLLISKRLKKLPETIAHIRKANIAAVPLSDFKTSTNGHQNYYAKNEEKYEEKEFSDFFDLQIDEYTYYSNLLKSLDTEKMKDVWLSDISEQIETREINYMKAFITQSDLFMNKLEEYAEIEKRLSQYFAEEKNNKSENNTPQEKYTGPPSSNFYYSVDGSKWDTEEKRDKQEDILFQEIELNLAKMKLNGLLKGFTEKDLKTPTELKKLIQLLRAVYKQAEPQILIYQEELLAKEIRLNPGYSKNGEYFVIGSYKEAYNYVIDFYFFFQKIKEYSGGSSSDMITLFYFTNDFIKTKKFSEDIDVLTSELAVDLKAIDSAIEEVNKETYILKKHSRDHYAIDSKKFNNAKDRDKYEKQLLDNLSEKINNTSKTIQGNKGKEYYTAIIKIIGKNIELFRQTDPSIKKAPHIKEAYKALNNEIFYCEEIRDGMNHVVQLYKITNKTISDTNSSDTEVIDEIFGYSPNELLKAIEQDVRTIINILEDLSEKSKD